MEGEDSYKPSQSRRDRHGLSAARLLAGVKNVLIMGAWDGSRKFRYGMAVACVLIVAILRWTLAPLVGEGAAYLPFALVILVVVLWCGPAAAVLAAALSFGFGLVFAGRHGFGLTDVVSAAVFFVTAGGIIAMGEIVNRFRRTLIENHREAERRAGEFRQIAEELNLLIDGAQDQAIYMLDTTGHVTIWNKGAERLKGWREDEVIGRHSAMFYPADSLAAGKADTDLARARADTRFETEDWRLRKNGTEFLAAVSITALFDETGDLRGFAKVISDITERRAAETKLRARESLLTSILSTVPDAMVVIDAHGAILSFSHAAQSLFGYGEDEVTGHNVSMLMTDPDRGHHDRYLSRYLETREPHIIGKGRVVVARRKDGTTLPVELSIGEARDGEQHIFAGFMRDLTEQRQTQERLDGLQSELIHVSRVSAMGTMASTLAHELNQPIAAVVNYVQAVRDQMADDETTGQAEVWAEMREALDYAAQDALRAGLIVRRLRDFVARGSVERASEDLSALINDAAALALLGAGEQGIQVSFDLAREASSVFVERVQIQQVLINLLRNACEAMMGCPVRHLRVATRLVANDLVQVTVSDTGPGVSKAIRDQLFAAFSSTKQDGMGLGLSICRTIVEAHDGKIWLESHDGRGTTFHFTLPRGAPETDHGQQ